MRSHLARLLKVLRHSFADGEVDVVRRAYRLANDAHRNQTRLSGEPYILHSIVVSHILAQLGLDPVVCAAAMLHDVLEDTPVKAEQLKKEFGAEILALVEGVTKIGGLGLTEATKKSVEIKQAQNIRKMLVATAKDVRVILIKLADRLHNIRTIEFLPREKQVRIAQETLDIYAPLAHRLGISQWKWELEDHAFHVLMPDEDRDISQQVATKRREREEYIAETMAFLEQNLMKSEVPARVVGRPKHLYSIYRKMMEQGKEFAAVMDILGLRIITPDKSGCYSALGVVHDIWPPVPGRLKDYIAVPKVNGYQAIHTVVMRENGQPMEIQIRSEEMDRVAREGIASHWIYKEKHSDERLESQLAWLRQMYEWLKDASAPDELMDSMRRDFRESLIYVFTPKGEVKELPSGATPLDFAYLIHSDIGNHCIGARVNGRMVPLRYNLQLGDVLEILTSKNQVPHLDWLDSVVTGRARTRIRQKLREMGELDPIEEVEVKKPATPHIRRVKAPAGPVRQVDESTRQKLICIDGKKGLQVQFGRCCNPMPGQDVAGYVTKTPGITVHRADCSSFARSAKDTARIVEASWEGDLLIESMMRIIVRNRPNVLADITNVLRPLNIDILRANLAPTSDDQGQFDFVFQARDEKSIRRVEQVIKGVPGVMRVTPMRVQESKGAAAVVAG